MTRSTLWLLASAVAIAATPAAAQVKSTEKSDRQERKAERKGADWHLYLSTGASYSQRDEAGEPRTDYFRIPVSARLSNGRLRFSASTSYIRVKGPADVTGDDDDGGDTPSSGDSETRKGMGDLNLVTRYLIPDEDLGGFELDLMGRVKVPTASRRKRLGTGEVDYAMGAELSREIGSAEPFVSAQYRLNGDRPDQDYRNTVATSVGSSFRLSRRSRASLAWDYTQSRFSGRSGSHMLDGGISTRLQRGLTLIGDAAVGLSKRAPDFRVGATISAQAF